MSDSAVVYNNRDRMELDKMIRTISHRGPDLSGKAALFFLISS